MSSPYLLYDGAKVSAESPLGKELMKWERKPDYDPRNHPYPKMMYRAQNRPDGKRSVGEVLDSVCGGYAGAAEQWSRRCQLTVNDDAEKIRAYQQGWCDTPQEALEGLEKRENAISNQTAERHAADARMSEKAQAEAAAADQTTLRQLPEIPETPVRRKPGPKPKAQSV